MCMKVWEKLVEEKNGSCKLCLMCQGKKYILKEKKGEKKEKFKSKEMYIVWRK